MKFSHTLPVDGQALVPRPAAPRASSPQAGAPAPERSRCGPPAAAQTPPAHGWACPRSAAAVWVGSGESPALRSEASTRAHQAGREPPNQDWTWWTLKHRKQTVDATERRPARQKKHSTHTWSSRVYTCFWAPRKALHDYISK